MTCTTEDRNIILEIIYWKEIIYDKQIKKEVAVESHRSPRCILKAKLVVAWALFQCVPSKKRWFGAILIYVLGLFIPDCVFLVQFLSPKYTLFFFYMYVTKHIHRTQSIVP